MGKVAEQKVLIFDPELCTGCRYCEIACAFEHYGVVSPQKAHIRISLDEKRMELEAAVCQHCEEPLCVATCPQDAVVKDEKGWVKINPMKCSGCNSCVLACPLPCPWFDEERRVVAKCDFCDGDPVCARYCSPGALRIVTRAEAVRFNEQRYSKGVRL